MWLQQKAPTGWTSVLTTGRVLCSYLNTGHNGQWRRASLSGFTDETIALGEPKPVPEGGLIQQQMAVGRGTSLLGLVGAAVEIPAET